LAYEIKKNTEILKREKADAEFLEKYGDHTDELRRDLPTYVDMGAVKTASSNLGRKQKRLGVVYKIIGLLLIAALIFGAVLVIKHVIGSGGEDITKYLTFTEVELADHLGLTFEDYNQQAPKIQQYSGGTVTVRQGDTLQVIYINGDQVGVATDGRDYRFYGIGVNDMEADIAELMTFKSDYTFNVINDMMGGSSQSYYFCDTAKNQCLVLTISDKTHRVVYMTFYTDLKLISKDLSF